MKNVGTFQLKVLKTGKINAIEKNNWDLGFPDNIYKICI